MDREERIQEREAKKVAAEAETKRLEVEAEAKKVEAETKRLETEAETKRLEVEAETKRLETEAETKRLEIEAKRELDAKRLEADTEARRMDLEFKKAEAQQKIPGFKAEEMIVGRVEEDGSKEVLEVQGVGLCADVSHKKITEEVVLEKVVCGTSRAKAKKKLEDSPVPLKNVVTPDLSVNEEDLKSLLREDETLEEVLSVSREDEKYAVCAEKVVDVEEINSPGSLEEEQVNLSSMDDTEFETIHLISQEASSSENEELPPAKRCRGMAREWQKQRTSTGKDRPPGREVKEGTT
ncbi:calponin homology domain-containing protein DDB_G0272472-like [Littorina saxatilis]|uniref:calponin homology domain-containing protein DDB_G0272472-like n=1 Tax=Littorina saxatilis TaxID=31220 RepID=UPI0038B63206